MAAVEFTTRRAVFTIGVVIATLAVPATATFATAAPTAPPRVLAGCTTSGGPYDESLDCEPNTVDDFGAPSEMELTDTNPGVASPDRR
ncbi:MAG: hypothetical protein JO280_02815 [Mycobacteriaceae bacterium]|nr:hypothetical protein [Mycobacteriaceae bacterium]